MRLISTLAFFAFLYLLTGAYANAGYWYDGNQTIHRDGWYDGMQQNNNAFQDRFQRQQQYNDSRQYNYQDDDND
jgi:hypothetical protein